ncbi:MAG TPA: four helix bundle protein [Balneola sp.]|jgi:four helix bundle protein|nr:four helix bundle protein [Balneola sp.]MAO78630.1 four helix bundle protein [Balneola sp.]MBF63141.1 four helix bundle protein [Balneola sp.]HAH51168.1 four helix bundle protein [Balneola sp.]HBZ37464.1 four helix bundle protein [Balneola sp.]|tara:strand:+ start:30558 stop:30929 length:372 start_codon:yes stop_codon:yes gene_type:complete
MKARQYNLQNRLIEFSISIIEVSEKLPKNYVGQHFSKQLIRSGTSPAFQQAEAQSAESSKDFIHKLKIGIKELRETKVNLEIISRKFLPSEVIVQNTLKECDELVAIFYSSIRTAKANSIMPK